MVQLQFYSDDPNGAPWTQSTFDEIANTGYNAVELILPWTSARGIETSPGVYDFSLLDTYMGYAENDSLAVVVVFWYWGFTFGVTNWIPSWITSRELYSNGAVAPYPPWWDATARTDYFAMINATVTHLNPFGNFQGVYPQFGLLDFPWGPILSGEAGAVVTGYSPATVRAYDTFVSTQYASLADYNAIYNTSYTSWFQIPAPAPGATGAWNDFGNFRIFSVEQTFGALSQYVRARTNRTLFYYFGGSIGSAVIGVDLPDVYFALAAQYGGIVNVDDADYVQYTDLFASLAERYRVPFIQEWTPTVSGLDQGFNETVANMYIGRPWDVGSDFFTLNPAQSVFTWAFGYFGGLRRTIEAADSSRWSTSPIAVLVSYYSGFYNFTNNTLATSVLQDEEEIAISLAYSYRPFEVVTDLELLNGVVNLTRFSSVLDLADSYGDTVHAPYIQGDLTWFVNHGGNLVSSANSLAYLDTKPGVFQLALTPAPTPHQIDLQGSADNANGTLFVSASDWDVTNNSGTGESGSFEVVLSTWGLPTATDYYVTNLVNRTSSLVTPTLGTLSVPWSPAAGEVDFYQISTAAASALESVAVSPQSITLTAGGTQSFTAVPKCLAACPYGATYSWRLSGSGMGSISATTGASVTFTAGNVGGVVGLSVTATLNGVVVQSAPVEITVNDLTSVSVTPNTATLISGHMQSFTAAPLCIATCPSGTTYSWTLTKGGAGSLSGVSGASVTFTAGSTPQTVELLVNATLDGVVQQGLAILTIVNDLFSVTISPTMASVLTGGTTSPFTATPACSAACPAGTVYSWTLTNPSIGTLNSSHGNPVTFTAGSSAGTVTLFVNASLNGKTIQGSPVTITVSGSTSPANFFSGPTLLVLVVSAVAALAVATTLVLVRWRKSRPPPVPKQ
jgi:hypothetical protein